LIRGGIFILAAGALESPRILLNSRSDTYTFGLGNENDLVGRFLMRHYVDLVAIKPHRPLGMQNYNLKEIALNDFYICQAGKLGTFQSFGNFPPSEVITKEILQPLYKKGRLGEWGTALVYPLIQKFFLRVFKDRYFMAFIMEDLPYRDNRVTVRPDPENPAGMLQISYQISKSEKKRIDTFRRLLRSVLSGYKYTWIKSAEKNQRIAHACGTLRAGKDPNASVINADCRLHSISNLYVTDASFFPSSGGTNPGLTIAANGLRVAHKIIACRK
jgi:choline dehydrogenase-like flavoprotein